MYGQILKSLRLLSKGEVIAKTGSDFIGQHVGESQNKTRAILELAEGSVLLIDECYVLDDQNYGKQVLDTIVEKVLGSPGEDIAVVMIGYEKEISKMLRNQNPGLARRFDLSYALSFDDFDDEELLWIFSDCCKRSNLEAPIEVKCAAVKQLSKQRTMKNFGNAGAVNNLLSDAKKRRQLRLKRENKAGESSEGLTAEDITGQKCDFEVNPMQILKDLESDDAEDGYTMTLLKIASQIMVRKREGGSFTGIVQNFVLTGSAGVGKSTVAKKLSEILYAFGLLATDKVVETSGLGLTGQYVGQTKKAVEEKMEQARGGCLFIDEAYDLGVGGYGPEAITQLLAMLTLDEYKDGKTVVIMAGYSDKMQQMMSVNEGLASRFEGHIHFEDWDSAKCVNLVKSLALKNEGVSFKIEDSAREVLLEGFETLSSKTNPRKGWANARDAIAMFRRIRTERDNRISKKIKDNTYDEDDEDMLTTLTEQDAALAVAGFLKARPLNSNMSVGGGCVGGGGAINSPTGAQQLKAEPVSKVDLASATSSKVAQQEMKDDVKPPVPPEAPPPIIIICIEATTWNHENAKVETGDPEKKRAAMKDNIEKLRDLQDKVEKEADGTKKGGKMNELKAERKRQMLLNVSNCPANFGWRKVSSGWTCTGLSHHVSDIELEALYVKMFPN